jgi:hypothetical protein
MHTPAFVPDLFVPGFPLKHNCIIVTLRQPQKTFITVSRFINAAEEIGAVRLATGTVLLLRIGQ